MSPANVAIAIAFAIWLIVSIANQFPGLRLDKLRQFDAFGLIPLWTFFAPNPGISDHHVLFRDRLVDGSVTFWRDVSAVSPRRWVHALWHPERRRNKAILDISAALSFLTYRNDHAVMVSVPYLLLLNFVSCRDRSPLSESTQFVILLETPCNQANTIVFLSQFHRLC